MSAIQAAPAKLRFIHRVKDASEKPGVYALWCLEGNRLSLFSVKDSSNIKITWLIYHQLQKWHTHAHNRIVFSACYTPELDSAERRRLAEKLKKELPSEHILQ